MVGRLVILAAVGCLLQIGPAAADPGVDAAFVDALSKAGIRFNDPQNAVVAGRTACGLLDAGRSQYDVVQLVVQENSGIGTVNAAKFTAIAASAFCPQHLKRAETGASSPTS